MSVTDFGKTPVYPTMLREDGSEPGMGESGGTVYCHAGITQRELFALHALPTAWAFFDKGYCGNSDGSNLQQVAQVAVQMADALIAELNGCNDD